MGQREEQYERLKDILLSLVGFLETEDIGRFIVDLDKQQQDVDFTIGVVTELATSLAQELATDEAEVGLIEVAGYGNRMMVHPEQIVTALATEPPSRIIEIMGRALAEAQKMAKGADELLDSPCMHEGECGCPEAQFELDLLSWSTPKGIQRLDKLVQETSQKNCTVCEHAASVHNDGRLDLCLPGLGHLFCMGCAANTNKEEKKQ
jgi:hypothetical protein